MMHATLITTVCIVAAVIAIAIASWGQKRAKLLAEEWARGRQLTLIETDDSLSASSGLSQVRRDKYAIIYISIADDGTIHFGESCY